MPDTASRGTQYRVNLLGYGHAFIEHNLVVAASKPAKHPPVIRNGTSADIETLVTILADGFASDPMLNWVIPPVKLYRDYFRLLLQEVYLPRGMVHLENNGNAAALWLPPEERFQMAPRRSLLKLVLRLLMTDGLRGLRRMREQGAVFTRQQPTEPHYYLQFLSCRSANQGQGIGSALLDHGTRICDERGVPAYLESSNSKNVPLYERFGFEVIASETVGRAGPTVWFMWRECQ
ncbi:MAG: GNAT family N-acetyltransferase [Gammaproteobacteria bacterium]|nr:GNAT family N-acetyltransferase [Gammaproteobacteria bacterium]